MINEILKEFKTSSNGLSSYEAKTRLDENGFNELKENNKQSPLTLFLKQFLEILIILLFIAAIAAYFIGDIIDSCVILIVILFNGIIGFIQEFKAEKAMENLKNLVSTNAVVKREGEIIKIPSKELTIGDLVLIEEGDKIPADLILIEANDLKIDESLLTGESEPVKKDTDYNDINSIDLNKERIDESLEKHLTFMDSTVTSGRGKGIVYAVGMKTEIGKIAGMIQESTDDTPLQRKVDKLGKTLGIIAVIICIFVFSIQLYRGIPLVETFMTAVSLAVAAVPEGLPAVLTLTLALGMQEMSKSNAIVRRLLAVETLGSCTIICSDKTGTLTKNKMTVYSEYFTNKEKSMKISCLCNNATIKNEKMIGDSTDIGIMSYVENNNYFKNILENEYPRVLEIPLDSIRKRMTTVHRINDENNSGECTSNNDELYVLSKGAPEIILDLCKYIDNDGTIKKIDDEIKNNLVDEISKMTNSALRVIGIAYKKIRGNIKKLPQEEIESELIFTGFIGLIDPPREEAYIAVEDCKKAGINVIMITGDHEDTAKAIAKEIGILNNGKVITGNELNKLSEKEYLEIVDELQVYARVYPEQKMRIVETLQKKGNIVSMTGDGVNDSPALKKASIGVAMGTGTDVAKESSDMVIQDDNFVTIVKAVKEGRKIYDNIKRFVKFQVSTNIGAILTIFGTSILSLPLPFNPIQILWINIIMDGPPAQSLGMEGAEKDIMKRSPEKEDILNKKVLMKIIISGIVMAIGTIGLFIYKLKTGSSVKYAMTVAFTLFVMYQLFNTYNCKSNSKEKNKFLIFAVLGSFILQLLVVYLPYLQIIFRTTSISFVDWIMIFIIASTIILAEKITKRFLSD